MMMMAMNITNLMILHTCIKARFFLGIVAIVVDFKDKKILIFFDDSNIDNVRYEMKGKIYL